MKLNLDNLPATQNESEAFLFKMDMAEKIAKQLTASKHNNSFEVENIAGGDAYIRVLDSDYDFIGLLMVNPVMEA